MYVCICHAVTEADVREKAYKGCFAFSDYAVACKGSCCKCLPRIKEIVHEENAQYYKARDSSSRTS